MDKKEYKALTIPKLEWNAKTLTETYGELIAQPLEPGYGITLGNAIRRILLGGVEGSGVTSVIIKGVNNEFATLSGVVEDTMQLILNIKEIVVKNIEGKSGRMSVRTDKAGPVTVADIKADNHLELVNKDHVIAHVSEGGSLDIEFFVETGRGYLEAQWPEGKPLQENGKIYIDAMLSPVRKVTFEVEKTRVGKAIDYDKLSLRIHTDGAENPVDVTHYAVSVLRTQLEHFMTSSEIPFNEISKHIDEEEAPISSEVDELSLKGIPVDLLVKPVEELELSVRAHNCLIQDDIKRIIDLVNLTEDEVLKIKNFGRKSLNEVKDSLKAFGLSLNMNIKEEDLKKYLKSQEA